MAEDEFKKVIESRHEIYKASVDKWEEYRIVYDGDTEFFNAYLNEFSEREKYDEYKLRKERVYNPLPIKPYISTLTNMTWRQEDNYTYDVADEEVKDIIQNNIDGKEHSIFTMHVNEILPIATKYRYCWLNTAMPSFDEDITRDQEQSLNLNPFIQAYAPQSVLDWEYEENSVVDFSKLLMVRYEYQQVEGERFKKPVKVFMLYEKDVIRKLNTEGQVIGEYDNSIGKVAFSLIDIGASFLQNLSAISKAALNIVSSSQDMLIKNNLPLFVRAGKGKMSKIDIGASRGVDVGEGGKAEYAAYPTDNMEYIAEHLKAMKDLADATAHQKYQSIATSQVQQSGVSQKENFKDVDAALSWINGTISESLIRNVAFMGDYMGKKDVQLQYKPAKTYMNVTPEEAMRQSEQMLDLADRAKSKEMKAALSDNAYEPLLVKSEDKENILEAEEKAILTAKAMDDAVDDADSDIQN